MGCMFSIMNANIHWKKYREETARASCRLLQMCPTTEAM